MTATLVLTRPDGASQRFLADVRAAFGQPVQAVISPMMSIVPKMRVWDGGPVDGVILSSEHGAVIAGQMGFDPGLPAYCVGDRTAKVARNAGFAAISAGGDATDLVQLILDRWVTGRLAHLHGEHTRGDVALRLNEAGVPCSDHVVYAQIEVDLNQAAHDVLMSGRSAIVPLFSPRTAALLARKGPFHAPIHVIAMSEAVAEAALALGSATVDVAERPDATAMLMATVNRLRKLIPAPSA